MTETATKFECRICGDARVWTEVPGNSGSDWRNLFAQSPTCRHEFFYLCRQHSGSPEAKCSICGCGEFFT